MASPGAANVTLAPIRLDLQAAIEDSPQFRASLYRNEEELDVLASIVENLIKGVRTCLELGASKRLLFLSSPLLTHLCVCAQDPRRP